MFGSPYNGPRIHMSGALALVALLSAGCCGPAFRVDDMAGKTLASPWDALDVFRTAIRLEEWSWVYDSVSTKTKERIQQDKPAFIGDVSALAHALSKYTLEDLDPHAPKEVADLRIVDLIHRARIIDFSKEKGRDDRWSVSLKYPPLDLEVLPIVRERGADGKPRWTIGIEEWIEERAQ